jgi:nicotinamidase-related amidase
MEKIELMIRKGQYVCKYDCFERSEILQEWNAQNTGAIICDMWQNHWCKGAALRTAQMAPRMNQVLTALRRSGVTIAHAPSDTMDFYSGFPGRINTLEASQGVTLEELLETKEILINEPKLEIDPKRVECDCAEQVKCAFFKAWYRQIEALEISDNDLIGEGDELLKALKARGILNIIIMGVHTNLCILARPFGIRNLLTYGFHVALVRDLTDCMAPHDEPPYVDHFTALDLVIWHIEKYLCGTVTSCQLLKDDNIFRFPQDKRV